MPKIRVKHVVEDVDRHGNVRLYLRRRGLAKVRLEGPLGSPVFWKSYHAGLLKKRPKTTRAPGGDKTGTFRWLCEQYFVSAPFKRLGPRTRYVRRGLLDRICMEKGSHPFTMMEPRHVRAMRDEIADRPEAANAFVKSLRQVFNFAVEYDLAERNPARDVPYIRSGSQGIHSWTPDEVLKFEKRHPVGTKARLAFGLLLYTGQRRSDVIRLGRQHLSDRWLQFTQHKNRDHKPVTLQIPVIDDLQRILDASETGDLTFLVSEFGRPFSDGGFGNRFRKWCDDAGLKNCSAHGLRKATAATLAELGCSEHEIMAITGHQTSKEVTRYTKAARQKLMAKSAMEKLSKG
ncbi:MAG: tyrosine-type recombinase/integrase [Rhodobacteraceae bacterium]|nr:tyrosine-type recombinase/integrase [Paracoccaceae bacterium]